MKVTSIKETTFDEMVRPETLYKYRRWDDVFHKTIITKREVFFAKPSSFEDDFDCKIPIRYDLLDDSEIFNKFLEISIEKNKDCSLVQHLEDAKFHTNKCSFHNKEDVINIQKKYFDEFDNNYGILSLTADIFNLEMWKHYSDDNRGFAVGFDPLKLFPHLGGGGEVIYYDELPVIYPYPKHTYEEQIFLQNYSKLRKWEFEKEYRTQLFSPYTLSNKDRTKKIPSIAYKEIILGTRMDESTIQDLIKHIPKELKHIPILQARLDNDKIKLFIF